MLKQISRVALGGLLALATSGTAVAVTTAPAAAKVVCSAGVWGGNHGWGDCSENSVPGPRKWKLWTHCSWGTNVSSGVLTGAGHVDTTCPWPQSAQYSSIEYIN
jgi:hypothetical protein